MYCSAAHCSSLHCTALHCTALHCTALHCSSVQCSVMKWRAVISAWCHCAQRVAALPGGDSTLCTPLPNLSLGGDSCSHQVSHRSTLVLNMAAPQTNTEIGTYGRGKCNVITPGHAALPPGWRFIKPARLNSLKDCLKPSLSIE